MRGSHLDNFRAVCEVFFVLVTVYSLAIEARELYSAARSTGGVASYFVSAWNYIGNAVQVDISLTLD